VQAQSSDPTPPGLQWIDLDALEAAAASKEGGSQGGPGATDAAVAMILDLASQPEHQGGCCAHCRLLDGSWGESQPA